MSDNDAMLLGLVILFVVALVLIGILIYAVPQVVIRWILFKAAGQRGWASLIPVYRDIVTARIAKVKLWIALFVGVVPFASNLVPSNALEKAVDGQMLSGLDITMLVLEGLSVAAALVALGLSIYLFVQWAKQYNRTVGFWILYVFVPVVAVFMLKDAHYTGDEAAVTASKPATV